MNMKKTGVAILAVIFSMTLCVVSAMAYGGGDGGGGDELQDTRESNNPPPAYQPVDPSTLGVGDVFVSVQPDDTTSVEPTEPVVLEDESVYDLTVALAHCPAVKFVIVTGGGILVGYATAGTSIVVQALAAGGYSMAMTHIDNTGKPANEQSSRVYSGVKDTAIAFIPVPPPAQAAISVGVDKTIEAITEPPAIKNPSPTPGGVGLPHTYAR